MYDVLLKLISDEIPTKEKEFKDFLQALLPEDADIEMGWGFINEKTTETVVRAIDLREIAPHNRTVFWTSAQKAFAKVVRDKYEDERIKFGLLLLLRMHKSICKGEPADKLTDLRDINPVSGNKIGPGW